MEKQTNSGKIYVKATFNNTIVTVTNEKGEAIAWASTSSSGFKGARKATPYAATVALENALKKAKDKGVKEVDVYIKGPGSGRDAVIKVIRVSGLNIKSIADVTPIPHNGPRPSKRRRS